MGKDYHIGCRIRQQLRQSGHTVVWFAEQLCCTRANAYKIFRKDNIDIQLLARISQILQHDFFLDLSTHWQP